MTRLILLACALLLAGCAETATAPDALPVHFNAMPEMAPHCDTVTGQQAICTDHQSAVAWILNQATGGDCGIYDYYVEGDEWHTRQVICTKP